ncbi:MAG TPA: tetratricopeptide repeat protein [Polyangiaceae bacterium]|nr:tetratricopeptide repeat protein [Polyangiaceae bacterium]
MIQRLAAVVALATATAFVAPAFAAGVPISEATPDQKKSASEAYKRGRAAFDEGRLDDALSAFTESYDIVASPNAHLMAATTLIALGRTGEAYEALDEVITEAEAAAATNPKYKKTAEGARTKQQEIEGEVGTLTVLGAMDKAPLGATLMVNDREIPQSRWSSPIKVKAGAVDVTLTGEPTRTVEVMPGSSATVDLNAPLPGAEPDDGAGVEMDSDGGYSGPDRMLITYIAGGVGVAGLVSFGIFGGLAKSKFDSLEESCPSRTNCPLELEGDASDGKTFQTVANVSLGIGIAGVVAAAGFLTWELLDPAEDGGDSPDGSDTAFRPRLGIGPGSVSLWGSF